MSRRLCSLRLFIDRGIENSFMISFFDLGELSASPPKSGLFVFPRKFSASSAAVSCFAAKVHTLSLGVSPILLNAAANPSSGFSDGRF